MSLNVVICWSYLLQCQYKSSGKFATISASSMSDSCFLINMTCINKASLYVCESSRANNAFVTHLRKWILPKSFVKSERDKSYCHAIISLFRMTAEQNIHVTTIFFSIFYSPTLKKTWKWNFFISTKSSISDNCGRNSLHEKHNEWLQIMSNLFCMLQFVLLLLDVFKNTLFVFLNQFDS